MALNLMWTIMVVCVLGNVAIASRVGPAENLAMVTDDALGLLGEGHLVSEFRAFASRFAKAYETQHEALTRFRIFTQNWKLIHEANSANLPYKLEINEFADISWEEFKQHKLGASQNCSATEGGHVLTYKNLPLRKDWRDEGVVSPVKNQGHCGSCWTFSTTGALEAAYLQKTGNFVSLSEQQLVDCAGEYNNHGCNGGLPSQAFEYVKYNGGIDTEDAYPYLGQNDQCHFAPKRVGARVADVVNITEYDEASLQDAVAFVRPVSIAFEVVDGFRFYKSGVYVSDTCKSGPDTVNHAVLAVGYDTSEDVPYWVVKNSWGAEWGDEGFFKIKLGQNMCGVATCASYPVLED
ncbi:unnamed protein product [Closterium sp. NIES-64]|nr:unnamed protein product [Closterium sp. NIES-64]